MKKVLIVGGGFAGTLIAKKLQKNFNVVLIDTKDYFEFTPGILRSIVEPEHLKKIQILHSTYLKNAQIIKGEVKKVSDKYVFMNGKKLSYDYLVLSSGSRYNSPIKAQNMLLASRTHELKEHSKKLESSNKVLIIGGGLVGVELAAEILEKFPKKETIIVHSKDRLIERNPKKASKYARDYLTKKGVKIIFNERVVKARKSSFFTSNNTEIKADIAFFCTGITPNTEFIKKSFPNSLNERNQVKVNNALQLENNKNIFAAGDITSVKEEKTAQNSKKHAAIIIKNILRMNESKELLPYKPAPRIMVISLGKYNGILTYKKLMLTGLFPGILKTIIEKREMFRYKKFMEWFKDNF